MGGWRGSRIVLPCRASCTSAPAALLFALLVSTGIGVSHAQTGDPARSNLAAIDTTIANTISEELRSSTDLEYFWVLGYRAAAPDSSGEAPAFRILAPAAEELSDDLADGTYRGQVVLRYRADEESPWRWFAMRFGVLVQDGRVEALHGMEAGDEPIGGGRTLGWPDLLSTRLPTVSGSDPDLWVARSLIVFFEPWIAHARPDEDFETLEGDPEGFISILLGLLNSPGQIGDRASPSLNPVGQVLAELPEQSEKPLASLEALVGFVCPRGGLATDPMAQYPCTEVLSSDLQEVVEVLLEILEQQQDFRLAGFPSRQDQRQTGAAHKFERELYETFKTAALAKLESLTIAGSARTGPAEAASAGASQILRSLETTPDPEESGGRSPPPEQPGSEEQLGVSKVGDQSALSVIVWMVLALLILTTAVYAARPYLDRRSNRSNRHDSIEYLESPDPEINTFSTQTGDDRRAAEVVPHRQEATRTAIVEDSGRAVGSGVAGDQAMPSLLVAETERADQFEDAIQPPAESTAVEVAAVEAAGEATAHALRAAGLALLRRLLPYLDRSDQEEIMRFIATEDAPMPADVGVESAIHPAVERIITRLLEKSANQSNRIRALEERLEVLERTGPVRSTAAPSVVRQDHRPRTPAKPPADSSDLSPRPPRTDDTPPAYRPLIDHLSSGADLDVSHERRLAMKRALLEAMRSQSDEAAVWRQFGENLVENLIEEDRPPTFYDRFSRVLEQHSGDRLKLYLPTSPSIFDSDRMYPIETTPVDAGRLDRVRGVKRPGLELDGRLLKKAIVRLG